MLKSESDMLNISNNNIRRLEIAGFLTALRRMRNYFVVERRLTVEEEETFANFAAERTMSGMYVMAIITIIGVIITWPSDYFIFAGDDLIISNFVLWRTLVIFSCSINVLINMMMSHISRLMIYATVMFEFSLLFLIGGYSVGRMGGLDQPFFYVSYGLMAIPMLIQYPFKQRLLANAWFMALLYAGFIGLFPQHVQHPYFFSVVIVSVSTVVLFGFAGHVIYVLLLNNFITGIALKEKAVFLEEARRQSDVLLANILPQPIADRLKLDKSIIADGFWEATVLFADIVGFTKMAERLSPDSLVKLLDDIFTIFDGLTNKYGLEKIKTIGDGYMVAGGIPLEKPAHAEAVAELAIEMQSAVTDFSRRLGKPLGIRIGINTGPLVAGVIGKTKFSYDLWGDTVNTASRMESHGEDGKIQVTRAVYEKLKDKYEFVPRGMIQVKGKGEMEAWFLTGRKSGDPSTSTTAS